MSKKIRNFIMLNILPPVIALFLALLRITLRIEHINQGPIKDAWAKGTDFIVCFWHGRLLMMPFAKKHGGGKVLISRHRDGELITRIIHFFKLGTVRGSYQKRSVSSLREIIHDLKGGYRHCHNTRWAQGATIQSKERHYRARPPLGKSHRPRSIQCG